MVDFSKNELGVEDVEVGDWKKGNECVAAEVTTGSGETYRVVAVSMNGPPRPYEPLWVSQIYTLDDFIADSDVWCGLTSTRAYFHDKNGGRIIG